MSDRNELRWNHNVPEQSFWCRQTWNQTIITKLNQLWAMNRPFEVVPVKILTPFKFREIIENLEYYDKETHIFVNRFVFEYIEIDLNYLNFNNIGKIFIDNFN